MPDTSSQFGGAPEPINFGSTGRKPAGPATQLNATWWGDDLRDDDDDDDDDDDNDDDDDDDDDDADDDDDDDDDADADADADAAGGGGGGGEERTWWELWSVWLGDERTGTLTEHNHLNLLPWDC